MGVTTCVSRFPPGEASIAGSGAKAPKTFLAALGALIHGARERAGLTQAELARKTGLALSYVAAVERGERNPSIGVLRGLAIALGVETGRLIPANAAAEAERAKRGRGRPPRAAL